MTERSENMISHVEDPYFGQMNDPTSAATLTGPCGDTMEVYLVVRNDVIEDLNFSFTVVWQLVIVSHCND